jgi:hypothetical protein
LYKVDLLTSNSLDVSVNVANMKIIEITRF